MIYFVYNIIRPLKCCWAVSNSYEWFKRCACKLQVLPTAHKRTHFHAIIVIKRLEGSLLATHKQHGRSWASSKSNELKRKKYWSEAENGFHDLLKILCLIRLLNVNPFFLNSQFSDLVSSSFPVKTEFPLIHRYKEELECISAWIPKGPQISGSGSATNQLLPGKPARCY